MKFLKGMIPGTLSVSNLLGRKSKVDLEALGKEAAEIGGMLMFIPSAIEAFNMKQLRALNIYAEGIDAIGDTLTGVEIEVGTALIGSWKAEEELNEKGVQGEEKDRIIKVLHEGLKAKLVQSRIQHVLDGIAEMLEMVSGYEERIREIKDIIDAENKATFDSINTALERSNRGVASTLYGGFNINRLNPANHVFGELTQARGKLLGMQQEALGYQQSLHDWIHERLQAVEILREETGYTLELVNLFSGGDTSNSEK